MEWNWLMMRYSGGFYVLNPDSSWSHHPSKAVDIIYYERDKKGTLKYEMSAFCIYSAVSSGLYIIIIIH